MIDLSCVLSEDLRSKSYTNEAVDLLRVIAEVSSQSSCLRKQSTSASSQSKQSFTYAMLILIEIPDVLAQDRLEAQRPEFLRQVSSGRCERVVRDSNRAHREKSDDEKPERVPVPVVPQLVVVGSVLEGIDS